MSLKANIEKIIPSIDVVTIGKACSELKVFWSRVFGDFENNFLTGHRSLVDSDIGQFKILVNNSRLGINQIIDFFVSAIISSAKARTSISWDVIRHMPFYITESKGVSFESDAINSIKSTTLNYFKMLKEEITNNYKNILFKNKEFRTKQYRFLIEIFLKDFSRVCFPILNGAIFEIEELEMDEKLKIMDILMLTQQAHEKSKNKYIVGEKTLELIDKLLPQTYEDLFRAIMFIAYGLKNNGRYLLLQIAKYDFYSTIELFILGAFWAYKKATQLTSWKEGLDKRNIDTLYSIFESVLKNDIISVHGLKQIFIYPIIWDYSENPEAILVALKYFWANSLIDRGQLLQYILLLSSCKNLPSQDFIIPQINPLVNNYIQSCILKGNLQGIFRQLKTQIGRHPGMPTDIELQIVHEAYIEMKR